MGGTWRAAFSSAAAIVLAATPCLAQQPDFNGDGFADLAIGVLLEDVGVGAETIVDAGAVNIIYGSADGLSSLRDQVWTQESVGILETAGEEDRFGFAVAVGDFNGDGFDDLAVAADFEDVGPIENAGAVNVLYASNNGLSSSGDQLWHQSIAGVLDVAEAHDRFGHALAAGDFDDDGFDDLAIGVPDETIDVGGNPIFSSGVVNVLYGSAAGLAAAGNQVWDQSRLDVLDVAEADDKFGWDLAADDFDGDGFQDLAVGVPGEGVGTVSRAGAVSVLYGSIDGLLADGDQFWSQSSSGVEGTAEEGDQFGTALAAGDFDGDGHADLAIGPFGESVGAIFGAGSVNVLYGTPAGLSAADDQLWTQDSPGILGGAEDGDRFGEGLAAGDFDGDGLDDLAVSVRAENVDAIPDAGSVNVLYGSATGLTVAGNQLWHQDSPGVLDAAEATDEFGFPAMAGDFDGDGFEDLAVGSTGEIVGGFSEGGAVHVFYGGATGLTAVGDQFWNQNSVGILDAAELGDLFGWSLAD